MQEGMISIEEIIKCKNVSGLTEPPLIEGFVRLIHECRAKKDLALAKQVHAYVCNIGIDLHRDVGNYVVLMYVGCGSLPAAHQAFKRLPSPNVSSWTSLMLGFIECEKSQHAFHLYHSMKKDKVYPSTYTFMALLQACARLKDTQKGREIHVEIAQLGHEGCVYVGSALVHMYAKCRLLLEAEQVIKTLPVGNVVSWNALIAGYTEYGLSLKAMECLEQMERDTIHPDIVTFICVLKACGNSGKIQRGHAIHLELVKQGMDTNSIVGNALVDMYAKCGVLIESHNVFDHLPVRDFVSWTALISGYAEHGPCQEALSCFEQFQREDATLDATIFSCVLKLCGSIGAVEKGLELHNELYTRGIERNLHVGSTLVDMYAKCGRLMEAWEVLDKQPDRNVVLWNALINGYGINEESDLAVEAFEIMQKEGVKPDAVTFLCLLTACSRTSLVLEGQGYVKTMIDAHGILPSAAHFMCNVDLLARSGRLCEADKFLKSIPCQPSKDMWTSLLSACKTYEGEAGQRCFDQLIQTGSWPNLIEKPLVHVK